MSAKVRPARADDAGAIAAIYAHHVAHGSASFDTVAPDTTAIVDKIARATAQGWPFLVAENEGIAGYAYAAPFRDRPAYRATCEDSIYVAPNRLRCGTGALLLAALIEAAQTHGFRQMIAVIGGGEPASVALHARMGFEHAGRMRSVGFKHGQWLDTVYMQRTLGAGDATPPGTVAR